MPVMKEVVKIMIGENESKKLNAISLSNSTVKRRITDMSDDVLEQILTHVKRLHFTPSSWMNPQILQVCPSFPSLFATSTMVLYHKICYFAKH